ncbi:hypothetical protein HJ590_15335 [Naumannella sp. ID2617S]|uniref:TadE family type IV pilus minor pilin n=1 Tax=Enemella dayhoffiae TaxID=2016507 RepID=UPI001487920D|nr:TadE family type IV pilus minor pilin [Enemella dayhoffiae]NNG20906.1 hypothetical protein [Naumannella sp. ID2617S]
MTVRPARAEHSEHGSSTVELAVGLIAILLGAAAGVWLVLVVVLQIRVVDTAAEIARQEARGDRAAVSRAEAGAPSGASISRGRQDGLATVTVRLAVRPLAALPAVPLSSTARVLLEPGE